MYKVRDMFIIFLGYFILFVFVYFDDFICVVISINWFEFKFGVIFFNFCIIVGKCVRLGLIFFLLIVEMFLFKLYIFLDFLYWEYFKYMLVFEFKEIIFM